MWMTKSVVGMTWKNLWGNSPQILEFSWVKHLSRISSTSIRRFSMLKIRNASPNFTWRLNKLSTSAEISLFLGGQIQEKLSSNSGWRRSPTRGLQKLRTTMLIHLLPSKTRMLLFCTGRRCKRPPISSSVTPWLITLSAEMPSQATSNMATRFTAKQPTWCNTEWDDF